MKVRVEGWGQGKGKVWEVSLCDKISVKFAPYTNKMPDQNYKINIVIEPL